jgi:hypothetical protein
MFQENLSPGGNQQACQDTQSRSLAGTVGANDSDDFAGFNVQGQVPQNPVTTIVGLAYPLNPDSAAPRTCFDQAIPLLYAVGLCQHVRCLLMSRLFTKLTGKLVFPRDFRWREGTLTLGHSVCTLLDAKIQEASDDNEEQNRNHKDYDPKCLITLSLVLIEKHLGNPDRIERINQSHFLRDQTAVNQALHISSDKTVERKAKMLSRLPIPQPDQQE